MHDQEKTPDASPARFAEDPTPPASSPHEAGVRQPAAAPIVPLLIVVEGKAQGSTARITRPETAIGRASENHLVLNSAGVSRFHARILQDGTRCLVEDLGSTHGVEVNGTRIESWKALPLCHGDYLRLFDHLILYHERAQISGVQAISSIRIDKSRVRAEADALLEAVPGIELARERRREPG